MSHDLGQPCVIFAPFIIIICVLINEKNKACYLNLKHK